MRCARAARFAWGPARDGGDDRDAAVLADIEQPLIATDKIIHHTFDSALEVTIISRVIPNDVQPELAGRHDSEVAEFGYELAHPRAWPAMEPRNSRVLQHVGNLIEDGG